MHLNAFYMSDACQDQLPVTDHVPPRKDEGSFLASPSFGTLVPKWMIKGGKTLTQLAQRVQDQGFAPETIKLAANVITALFNMRSSNAMFAKQTNRKNNEGRSEPTKRLLWSMSPLHLAMFY